MRTNFMKAAALFLTAMLVITCYLPTSATAYAATGVNSVSNEVKSVKLTSKALDTQPPAAPSDLAGTADKTSIRLTWTASTDNVRVENYVVFRDGIKIDVVKATHYTDKGLTPGQTYNYTVKAFDAAGNGSDDSNVLSITTVPLDTQPPTTPSDLAGTADKTSIRLTWTASTDNVRVENYVVFRDGIKIDVVKATHYTDKGLTPGQTYNYTVKAFDAAGNGSDDSNVLSITTVPLDTQPPTTPSDLAGTADKTSIRLTWTASTDNVRVENYVVFRDGIKIDVVKATHYTDKGLTSGQTYNYTVKAYDAAGNGSDDSNVLCITTVPLDAQPPTTPSDLTGTADKTSIRLTWTASTDNVGVKNYVVFRDRNKITVVKVNQYTDSGLTPGQTYTYIVKAFDAAGNSSADSNAIQVTTLGSTTPPVDPKGLIPDTLSPVEGTDSNILDMLNKIPGMSATGATLTIGSSDNSQIDNTGAITYGFSAVTGNITIVIAKADGTTDSKTVSVTVPAHMPTDAELANQAIAVAKGLIPDILKPVEGIDTNVLDMLNKIPGMSATGVTLTIGSSDNSQIDTAGAITYGFSAVTGNVTVSISKTNGTTDSKAISVSVSETSAVPITIKDPNLETVIRNTIGKPTGDILKSDVAGITTLDACSRNISDLTGIQYLTNLNTLYLTDNKISDISPLRNLTNLISLNLYDNNINDISSLSGLENLSELWLSYNQISDINCLENLTNLTLLDLCQDQISDISSLRGMTKLYSLGLYNNQISDISSLAGMTDLTYLFLSGNPIEDISALVFLHNLIYLELIDDKIQDASPLGGLTKLEELYLNYNQITDISYLRNLVNLTNLGLVDNNINDVSCFSGVEFPDLIYLNLQYNQISNIDGLSNLTSLLSLDLSHNQISDISSLAGLTNLTALFLSSNPISSYNPIQSYYNQLTAKDFTATFTPPSSGE